jgi:hypothetical protein
LDRSKRERVAGYTPGELEHQEKVPQHLTGRFSKTLLGDEQ